MMNWLYVDHVSGAFDRRQQERSESMTSVSKKDVDGGPKFALRMEFRKTHMSDESIGTERRKIDNRKSLAKIVRELRISKEWIHSIQITIEQSTSREIESRLGGNLHFARGIFNIGIEGSKTDTLEEKIAEHFRIETQEKHIYEDLLRIEVPPQQNVEINIDWKQIWQHGEVDFIDDATSKHILSIPFKFNDHITYDVS